MSLWSQKRILLKARPRGCHLVTHEIVRSIHEDLRVVSVGLCHLFLQHTSASLSINENADSDVRLDADDILNRIVPDTGISYRHDAEGPDDMPAHAKSMLCGVSLTVPVFGGVLAMGTWQGIWLNEHRDDGGSRSVIVTIQGQQVTC